MANTAVAATAESNPNKKVIFKICAWFINCINRRKNTQLDDAHDTDEVTLMYNLIEYRGNYSKKSGILWQ